MQAYGLLPWEITSIEVLLLQKGEINFKVIGLYCRLTFFVQQ